MCKIYVDGLNRWISVESEKLNEAISFYEECGYTVTVEE